MNILMALYLYQGAVQGMEVAPVHLFKLPREFRVALAHHCP
jgi:hypothetical protein